MASDPILVAHSTTDVPSEPLNPSATLSSVLRPRCRVQKDRLVLELDRGMRAMGVLFVVWGLAFGVLGIVSIVNDWPSEAVLVGLLPGIFCPIAGTVMILAPRGCVFDRHTGRYTRRSLLGSDDRPLTEIVAVQAIPGRVVETRDDTGVLRRQTYELNLVFSSAPLRMPVTCTTDDNWIIEAGRAVSAFLAVPLIGPPKGNARG
jgi:hypothetical protein